MDRTDKHEQVNDSPKHISDKSLLLREMDDTAVQAFSVSKPRCEHIKRSVNTNQLRKFIFVGLRCAVHKKTRSQEDCTDDKEMLLCLQCGSCNCMKHAIKHYETPHSDGHYLTISLNDWTVRCHQCNMDIPSDSDGKLKNVYDSLQKNKSSTSRLLIAVSEAFPVPEKQVNEDLKNDENHVKHSNSSPRIAKIPSLPSPCGLVNLGNTCFFNSVLQCLAQTPFLLELLTDMSRNEKVSIPFEEHPFTAVLDKWGHLTETLANTLQNVSQGGSSSYNPNALLNALRQKNSQFVGYNQHDAHELLRTLLDAVKVEDSRRYQTQILHHFGASRKENPTPIDEKNRQLVRALNKKLPEIVNIRPDPVFKGLLASTVRCTKCSHQSEVIESFLDLSLPVSFEKEFPSHRRNSESNGNNSPNKSKSKHALKKEKQKARKMAKRKNYMKEDKSTSTKPNTESVVTNCEVDFTKTMHFGTYETRSNDPASERRKMLAEALDEVNTSPSPPVDDDLADGDLVKQESVVSNVTNDTNMVNGDDYEMNAPRTPSPSARSDTSGDEAAAASDDSASSNDDMLDEDSAEEHEQSTDPLCVTLQEPQAEFEDSSVYACFAQFTACETLTGNNKVLCEACTDRQAKAANKSTENGKKKPVYQPATKQLLILSPPPVLILHLKRFQSMSYSLRKVAKFVNYPLILDIGPFCSVKCQNLLFPKQKKVLYSLYGIVEHSGSLYTGHYVAYVKVREPLPKNSFRRRFLPRAFLGSAQEAALNEEVTRNKSESWYYISDTYVKQTSEEDVMQKQAYLLFYERIM